jgi:hypothetical protein
MIDFYLSLDQQNREKQDLDAIDDQASYQTDLQSGGKFDGICGLEPSKPEEHSYWDGYQLGLREHWAKKLNVEIPTEF